MSIIYDALKKVQGELKVKDLPPAAQKEPPGINKLKLRVKPYLFYLVTITFGFFTAGVVYRLIIPPVKNEAQISQVPIKTESQVIPASKNPKPDNLIAKKTSVQNLAIPNTSTSIKTDKTAASAEPQNSPLSSQEPSPVLVLNGIFFSGKDGYALINNRIVREGDTVGGLTVKKINAEAVELEGNNSNTKLLNNPR